MKKFTNMDGEYWYICWNYQLIQNILRKDVDIVQKCSTMICVNIL